MCQIVQVPLALAQSSQLFSTVSRTRLVYSLRLSLYRFDASTLAGDPVFGSLSKLEKGQLPYFQGPGVWGANSPFLPLNAGQDSCYVICRAPSILQNVETEFSRSVDIWVEHLADKFDRWWFVGVLFFKVHDKSESAVFKRGICRSDDNGVPVGEKVSCGRGLLCPGRYAVPCHDVVGDWRRGHSGGRVGLHALVVKTVSITQGIEMKANSWGFPP